MDIKELAYEGARGLIATGIEGAFDSVSCSTAGDYPSIGAQQVEGGRADELLSWIDGGDHFAGRSYSDIVNSGELEDLIELLGSEQSQSAQIQIISRDFEELYVPSVMDAGVWAARCIIYASMWCPTSHYIVGRFIENRIDDIDFNSLEEMHNAFYEQYAYAAGVEEYLNGYQNRADITYEYVSSLDLSAYGL